MRARVLIADDNPSVRKTLRHLLESAGDVDVVDAEDGQTAVTRALELHPDIAILDLAMPIMDGLKSAREISKALPQTVILLYTMRWFPQLEVEAKQSGVHKVVSKANSGTLLAAVREFVAARQEAARPEAAAPENVSQAAPASTPSAGNAVFLSGEPGEPALMEPPPAAKD